MPDSVIVGSHVVTPGGVIDANIVVEDGRISALTRDVPDCEKIDASGLVSLPGAIDPHVHYGVYSPIEQAALTESRAAALGGVTTMMRMLRLKGSYRRGLEAQLDGGRGRHHVDYAVHASIFDEAQAGEMEYCASRGVTSFKLYMNLGSDVGHVYMDMDPGAQELNPARVEVHDGVVGAVVREAARLGCPVLVHAEDYEACACGMREAQERGRDGLGAWSDSRPPESEAKSISRVCEHARAHGATVYFVHLGSRAALDQVRKERARGARVRVETCPHYLSLSSEREGYLAKVMPPVRSADDVSAVWAAVRSGGIDCVGTDHVANRLGAKLGGRDVWGALAGFPGIGTMLPVLLSEGFARGRLTLEQLARLASSNAARIFGMASKGQLRAGADADVTIVDTRLQRRADSSKLGGFSDYSVYEGWMLRGWPVKTLVRGQLVAEDFEVVGDPSHGRPALRS